MKIFWLFSSETVWVIFNNIWANFFAIIWSLSSQAICRLAVHLPVCQTNHLFICLSASLPIRRSVHLYICSSVHLPMCVCLWIHTIQLYSALWSYSALQLAASTIRSIATTSIKDTQNYETQHSDTQHNNDQYDQVHSASYVVILTEAFLLFCWA